MRRSAVWLPLDLGQLVGAVVLRMQLHDHAAHEPRCGSCAIAVRTAFSLPSTSIFTRKPPCTCCPAGRATARADAQEGLPAPLRLHPERRPSSARSNGRCRDPGVASRALPQDRSPGQSRPGGAPLGRRDRVSNQPVHGRSFTPERRDAIAAALDEAAHLEQDLCGDQRRHACAFMLYEGARIRPCSATFLQRLVREPWARSSLIAAPEGPQPRSWPGWRSVASGECSSAPQGREHGGVRLEAEHAGPRVTGLPERLGGDQREHALVGTDVEQVVRTQALADDSGQECAVPGVENGYGGGVATGPVSQHHAVARREHRPAHELSRDRETASAYGGTGAARHGPRPAETTASSPASTPNRERALSISRPAPATRGARGCPP